MNRWLSCLVVGMLLGCGGGEGGGEHKNIPRNRTLIMDCSSLQDCGGQIKDYNTFNPYLLIGKSNTGWNFLYEPLYFYNAYDTKEENIIPWIATEHEYNADYTEVVINIREGVEWSDGQPWTAHDLVFTINMLRDNAPELAFSTDMEAWVKEAVAVDELTAKITLNKANPRFVFSYFTHNFDNGVPIVPKHIWEGQDPSGFKNFDLAKGWPVVSGPYQIAISVPEQRVWDVRDDWWAQKVGFREKPKVERIIYLTHMEETKRVQNLISNTMDTSLDVRPPNIRSILDSNPNVSTWSGRELPHGSTGGRCAWVLIIWNRLLTIRRSAARSITRSIVTNWWQSVGRGPGQSRICRCRISRRCAHSPIRYRIW